MSPIVSALHTSFRRTARFSPRWTTAIAIGVLSSVLAGCGSSVRLDEAPVSDRTGAAINGAGDQQANASGMGQRNVPGVQADDLNANQPPANVARVIYFDFDSYAVRPEYASTLEGNAKFLKANGKRHVSLEGHTDERGGREYNLALGQKRAESVRRALAQLGVADAQMEAVSFGKEKPAVQGSSEEAFAKNRRVELSYR